MAMFNVYALCDSRIFKKLLAIKIINSIEDSVSQKNFFGVLSEGYQGKTARLIIKLDWLLYLSVFAKLKQNISNEAMTKLQRLCIISNV